MVNVKTLARYNIFKDALCSATENAVSDAIDIQHSDGNFSIAVSASTSVADVNWTYEVSEDGTNFDITSTSPTRTIIDAHAGVYQVVGFNVPLSKRIRIRATGDGSNPAGLTVNAKLMFSED